MAAEHLAAGRVEGEPVRRQRARWWALPAALVLQVASLLLVYSTWDALLGRWVGIRSGVAAFSSVPPTSAHDARSPMLGALQNATARPPGPAALQQRGVDFPSQQAASGTTTSRSATGSTTSTATSPTATTVTTFPPGPRTAVLFFGGVSRLYHSGASKTFTGKDLYTAGRGPFTPLRVTAAAFRRFLIAPNMPGVDTFAHCWHPELEAEYRERFRPLLAVFESNLPLAAELEQFSRETQSDYPQISWAHSVKRVFQLMVQYEAKVGRRYDYVVFSRADVILLKEMKLASIVRDPALVYVNSHEHGNGDFHFSMVRALAEQFARLPDSVSKEHPAKMHGWVQAYVQREMHTRVSLDGIVPGRDEEVYRKLPYMPKPRPCEALPTLRSLGFSVCDQVDLQLRCPGDPAPTPAPAAEPLRLLNHSLRPWACGADVPWRPVETYTCRVAVVLRGASARAGMEAAGEEDCPRAEGQARATRSVIEKLIRPLEAEGMAVDVFSATYTCPTIGEALGPLAPWLRADLRGGGQGGGGSGSSSPLDAGLSVAQYAWERGLSYRAAVVLPHDLELLADLAPLVRSCTGFCAPFQLRGQGGASGPPHTRVPDAIQVVRGPLYGCYLDMLTAGPWPQREIWDRAVAAGVNASDLGYLIQESFGSGSGSDLEEVPNPIYQFSPRHDPRTALLFFGGVSRLYHDGASKVFTGKDLYVPGRGPFTPLRLTSTAFKRFLITPNLPNVDVFAHCWHPELEAEYRKYFRPVVAVFESNLPLAAELERFSNETKSQYPQISWAHSVKRVFGLMAEYEKKVGRRYDRVVWARADVILLKEMKLASIIRDPALVYVNSHENGNGDFHFSMTRELAEQFARLPDSVSKEHPAQMHGWVQAYVQREMHTRVSLDGIVPGVDEEVYRKLPYHRPNPCNPLPTLRSLGFSVCDQADLQMRCPGDRPPPVEQAAEPMRLLNRSLRPWACGEEVPWRPVETLTCRFAIVLRGSYAAGGGSDSTTDCLTVDGQKQAAQSVIQHLIRPLEAEGMFVDVFSATHTCPGTDEALATMAKWLRADIRRGEDAGSGSSTVLDASLSVAQHAWERGVAYRAVMVLPHNLELKADVAWLLRSCSGFCVPFRMASPFGQLPGGVPDTVQAMRGGLFGCYLDMLEAGPWPREQIWGRMTAAGVDASEMGYLLEDFLGDPDPQKFANPLYKFAERGEGPVAPQGRHLAPATAGGVRAGRHLAAATVGVPGQQARRRRP